MQNLTDFFEGFGTILSALAGSVTTIVGLKFFRRDKNASTSSAESDVVTKATGNVVTVLGTLDDVLHRLDKAEERNKILAAELTLANEELATLRREYEALRSRYEALLGDKNG